MTRFSFFAISRVFLERAGRHKKDGHAVRSVAHHSIAPGPGASDSLERPRSRRPQMFLTIRIGTTRSPRCERRTAGWCLLKAMPPTPAPVAPRRIMSRSIQVAADASPSSRIAPFAVTRSISSSRSIVKATRSWNGRNSQSDVESGAFLNMWCARPESNWQPIA